MSEKPVLSPIFIEHEEEIRQLSRFQEFNVLKRQPDGWFDPPKLVPAIAYFIERFKKLYAGKWKEKFEELLMLYRKCHQEGDYLAAAEYYLKVRIEELQERKDHPELRKSYDNAEGLDFLMTFEKGYVDRSRFHQKNGIKIPIAAISHPGIDEQPDWQLALEKSGLEIDQVLAMIDEQKGKKP